MHKKIFLFILLMFLTGCTIENINSISNMDLVNLAITNEIDDYNVNNIGYRYHLPRGFSLIKNEKYNQVLLNNEYNYYLYIDIVSYYYKTSLNYDKIDLNEQTIYDYIPIQYNNKYGYVKITQNNDYFFIKMVYNYAIIEVQVKEQDVKTTLVNISNILSSIKFNDLIIKNLVGESVFETVETQYKLDTPKVVTESEDFLQIIEEYDEYTGSIENLPDTDIVIKESKNE